MIFELHSNDPFVAMCVSDYAHSVACCEYWSEKLENETSPEMVAFYEETYFFWDYQAFKQAKIIGMKTACDITGMVIRDCAELGHNQTEKMYNDVARAASLNFRSYVMSKQNIYA